MDIASFRLFPNEGTVPLGLAMIELEFQSNETFMIKVCIIMIRIQKGKTLQKKKQLYYTLQSAFMK